MYNVIKLNMGNPSFSVFFLYLIGFIIIEMVIVLIDGVLYWSDQSKDLN